MSCYMAAALLPHPLCGALSCRGTSFSHSNSGSQLARFWHGSSVFSSSVTLANSSASFSSSSSSPLSVLSFGGLRCSECSFSGTDQATVNSEHSDQDEACMQSSPAVVPRLLWCDLLVQWILASETRRSFIASFLQMSSSGLFCRSAPQLPSMQLSTATKSNVFARRVALILPSVITISAPCNSMALNSTVEETANVGRSFLQNLGIGDGDIYYPRLFEGSWICDSTLVAVDTPQGEEKADAKSLEFSRKQLGYTVTYKARFIPFRKYIIGDRLFTTLSLVESTVGSNIVDHGIWTPEQPDRLTLVLRGGLKVQNVVTKRSSFLSAPGQFDTSEYSQQIFDNNRLEGGPPTVKASQNQTRYKWDATNENVSYIEAFQRVSMFPVVEESLSNMDILNLDKPVTVYKYIVRFSRELS